MIRIWLTSENGEGLVNHLDFIDLQDVKIYTDNIGRHVEISIEELSEDKFLEDYEIEKEKNDEDKM